MQPSSIFPRSHLRPEPSSLGAIFPKGFEAPEERRKRDGTSALLASDEQFNQVDQDGLTREQRDQSQHTRQQRTVHEAGNDEESSRTLRHFFLPAFLACVFCFCIFFCKLAYLLAGLRAVCCRLFTIFILLCIHSIPFNRAGKELGTSRPEGISSRFHCWQDPGDRLVRGTPGSRLGFDKPD